MAHSQQLTAEMRECIQNCTECASVCLETVQHCLTMGGKHAEASHIRMLLDCAAICKTSAEFMLGTSPFHGRVCGVCAEVCRACAEDCQRMADGDETMRRCAESCRKCAESCQRMAQ